MHEGCVTVDGESRVTPARSMSREVHDSTGMKGNTTMITSVQSLTRRGERLPNGAVLIERVWTRTEDWADDRTYHESIVLALLNHGSRVEFVTWLCCLHPEQGEVTINGRYYDTLLNAVVGFKQRVGHEKAAGKFAPRILT